MTTASLNFRAVIAVGALALSIVGTENLGMDAVAPIASLLATDIEFGRYTELVSDDRITGSYSEYVRAFHIR